MSVAATPSASQYTSRAVHLTCQSAKRLASLVQNMSHALIRRMYLHVATMFSMCSGVSLSVYNDVWHSPCLKKYTWYVIDVAYKTG